MAVTQLEPALSVITPLGNALAMLVETVGAIVHWCCFQRDTGECWWWKNELIRLAPSITEGRVSITPIKTSNEITKALIRVRELIDG